MKLSPLNLILGVLLLALLALDGITWPRATSLREVLPLFEPWAPEQVATIRIEQGELGKFAEGPDLLVQRDDAGVFRLPAHFGYPARERAVTFLINGLASLTSMDLLSEDPASHETYGLTDERAVRILFEDAQGKVLADLLQGDKAPGGRAFYIRRSDSDKVYRAPNFVRESVSGNLLIWIETRWCTLDSDLVQRIELEGLLDSGSLVLTREIGSRSVWKNAQGVDVPNSKVQLLLRALSLVTLKGVTGDDVAPEAAGAGSIRLSLDQAGGATWRGRLLAGSSQGERRASIELPMATDTNPEAIREFELSLSPASVKALEKTLEKLRP
ncbi:MAG: hypothetical protein ACI87O_000376 [Planctomycetota bacterium]|jgi:hypothetical protein